MLGPSLAPTILVNNLPPSPPFFASADSEGVTWRFFGSANRLPCQRGQTPAVKVRMVVKPRFS